MLYKLCRKCKRTIIHPATYCSSCLPIVEEHKQQLLRERENRYNKKREPKYKLFFNSNAWKMLKDRKMMNEQYRCERCRRLATKYII